METSIIGRGFSKPTTGKDSFEQSITKNVESDQDTGIEQPIPQSDQTPIQQPRRSLYSNVKRAPTDPILGVTQAFKADTRVEKVNLGVGVVTDKNGEVPKLECVKDAEEILAQASLPSTYLPIDGLPEYNKAVRELMFGKDSALVRDNRVVTVQALGGTGALKIGADYLKTITPDARVYVSDPTWENHRGLFKQAGFEVDNYSYFDSTTHGVNFEGMLRSLEDMPEGSIVVLHACCHNPTGADLTKEQWGKVISLVAERNLIPFLDMAYQGFAEGIEADGEVVRRFANVGVDLYVANSFSKSFSLYGERVGALSIVTGSSEETENVLSNVKPVIRTNYSSPSRHGAEIVATVLASPKLRQSWKEDLDGRRLHIKNMRELFVQKLKEEVPDHDFSFILDQHGMFSYSGLTPEQVAELRLNDAIYALDSGRICIAALNENNIDRVVAAIARVLKKGSTQ